MSGSRIEDLELVCSVVANYRALLVISGRGTLYIPFKTLSPAFQTRPRLILGEQT